MEVTGATLRPAGPDDRGFLRRVFFSSWDRAVAMAGWPPEQRDAVLDQQFEAQDRSYRLTYPDADYDLILVAGAPVGRVYVRREENVIGLMEITLLPEWRNRGLGSGIIRGVLKEAEGVGKPVELYVEKWNPDARRLYLRLGFSGLEESETHWKMGWQAS